MTKIIKAGTVVSFAKELYSSHRVSFIARVNKNFDINKFTKDYLEKYPDQKRQHVADLDKFLDEIRDVGDFEIINIDLELNVGAYSTIEPDLHEWHG